MHLFTDCSVSPRTGRGIGGYLCMESTSDPSESLAESIELKTFKKVSSTELELRTLLWALKTVEKTGETLFIYTDSQNIAGLPHRRKRLEEDDYRNSSGEVLQHKKIYKEFYRMMDKFNFEVIKVKGHSPSDQKDEIEDLFSLLDRSTRKELRRQLKP